MTKRTKPHSDSWIDAHQDDPLFQAQVVGIAEFPPREARFGPIPDRLNPRLTAKLQAGGIDQLYSHQSEAISAALDGEDVVIATGTNSGKSLCYSLPTLQALYAEPAARALFLFPTKALARDQEARFVSLVPNGEFAIGTFDGDTPASQRSSIRKLSHVVVTNPDMLHIGILPSHDKWSHFLRSLRVIVIDEVHSYRGVFGCHVSGILRRLLRLAEANHSRPQILCASATIGNPVELVRDLTGRTPRLISEDGSKSGKRTFVLWNPFTLETDVSVGANVTTGRILAGLVQQNLRTLAFSRSRVSAELVLRYTRRTLEAANSAATVEAYRAGYTATERRRLEKSLLSGKLGGLSSTNALELGVDIGGLDAVVMNGYPGSMASFWQQAGRAGRGGKDGLAILVAREDPLDQFLLREPQALFERPPEPVTINPNNKFVLAQQLKCAAYERPIEPRELEHFGPTGLEVAEGLDRSGELAYQSGRFYYPSFHPPAPDVNIRSVGGNTFQMMTPEGPLGTIEEWRALSTTHTGAVYLHQGQTFVVDELDLDQKLVRLHQEDVDYYTQSISQTLVESLVEMNADTTGDFRWSLCGIRATEIITGYRLKSLDGERVLDTRELSLPPNSFETIAVRLDFPAPQMSIDDTDDLSVEAEQWIGTIHGTEHALLATAPAIATCDRNDLGNGWFVAYPPELKPAVFIYDRVPGGVGLAEALYAGRMRWIAASLILVRDCPCVEGCPSCLLSSRCESRNDHLSKQGTIELLTSFATSDIP